MIGIILTIIAFVHLITPAILSIGVSITVARADKLKEKDKVGFILLWSVIVSIIIRELAGGFTVI